MTSLAVANQPMVANELRAPGPTFLGIGAARAGTSWLHAQLSHHPQVWTTPIKELHYWDAQRDATDQRGKRYRRQLRHARHELMRWPRRYMAGQARFEAHVLRWYLRYFLCRRSDRWWLSLFPDTHPVRGEITPGYGVLLDDEQMAALTQLCPDLKYIFIMRDPLDRTWSALCRRFGGSVGEQFDALPAERFIAYLERQPWCLSIEQSRYHACLSRWREHVGDEQLMVGWFDDLCDDPAAFMRSVCEFLGVSPTYDNQPSAHVGRDQGHAATRGRPMPPVLEHYVAQRVHEDAKRLAAEFGGHASRWLERIEEVLARGA